MKKHNRMWRRLIVLAVATICLAAFGMHKSFAQGDVTAPTMADITSVNTAVDTAWVLLTGMLVFFMQAGFALLEAGLIRQTSVVNALLENFMDAGLTAICWWLVGFGLAFGTDAGGLIGTSMFVPGMSVMSTPFGSLTIETLTFFFFQFAFAATASTIATGGMAERTDFIGDVIYSGLIALVIYPIVVHWIWGGGWLAQAGFHDFAGSTVVHTVGGVIALVGAWMLGPRPGRVWGSPPPGHNMGFAVIGTMILWFGWYGFNPGSTLAVSGGVSGLAALVTVNTTMAAGVGALAAMFFVFLRKGKWDLPATLNGSLAGLVAITASCAFVDTWAAVVLGAIAGVLVIVVADVVEALHIDDAVGAFAVHGACGIWGTLSIGFFGEASLTLTGKAGLFTGGGIDLLITQFIGSASVVAFVALCSVAMFLALKAFGRLRVNPKADIVSIDFFEHGQSAWPDVLPFPGDEALDSMAASGAAAAAGD